MAEPPPPRHHLETLLKAGNRLNSVRGLCWGVERFAALLDGEAASTGHHPVLTAIAHLVKILRSLEN